jgi:U4/U6 small nuclear ribonucleoprotein SNU13
MNFKQLKKGVNESMKFLHRGAAELVILAVDCDPIEIVMGLPGKKLRD